MTISQREPFTTTLTGKILLAMPGMSDPRFHRAVILVCAHDENGAMGLVINHQLPGIDLTQLLDQLNIHATDENGPAIPDVPVLSGGPIENARGFLLHSNDFHQPGSVPVSQELSVTGTVDALRAVAAGDHPDKMIFVLGYAGWTEGQLDLELQENVWLVSEADEGLIFSTPCDEKWTTAMHKMGIDPALLSGEAGRA